MRLQIFIANPSNAQCNSACLLCLVPHHSSSYLNIIESQNHRKLSLEGTSRCYLIQYLCSSRAALELVEQGHTEIAFEYLQESTFHKFSGRPVPLSSHFHSKEVLLYVQETLFLEHEII